MHENYIRLVTLLVSPCTVNCINTPIVFFCLGVIVNNFLHYSLKMVFNIIFTLARKSIEKDRKDISVQSAFRPRLVQDRTLSCQQTKKKDFIQIVFEIRTWFHIVEQRC